MVAPASAQNILKCYGQEMSLQNCDRAASLSLFGDNGAAFLKGRPSRAPGVPGS